MLSPTKQRVTQLQSEICKTLSNPKRLQILHELRTGEKSVSELAAATGLRQATLSQHLAIMRLRKLVMERRVGNSVYYRTADRRINSACDIMQAMLIDQFSADSKFVRQAMVTAR